MYEIWYICKSVVVSSIRYILHFDSTISISATTDCFWLNTFLKVGHFCPTFFTYLRKLY